MRYIEKTNLCTSFEDYKKRRGMALQSWDNVKAWVKLDLHQHLWGEQKGLCVYCEQTIPRKVSVDSEEYFHPSHIEHIRPKTQFPKLAFDQKNLAVSCEGFNINHPPTPLTRDFCGHPKDNDYDEHLFLHPFEVIEIESYFFYDIQGKIKSSGKDDAKAKHTIHLLHLNHILLSDMRSEQYSLILNEISTNHLDIAEYLAVNNTELPAFYSMLKQMFL